MTKLINITIVLLFFPLYLAIGMGDITTTGSAAIYSIFIFYLIKRLLLRQSFRVVRFKLLIFVLIAIATVSALSVSPVFLVPSLRSYINFVASLLFFFVIVNHNLSLSIEKREKWIEFTLWLLILMVMIQIVAGMILYFVPAFGSVIAIFAPPYVSEVGTRVTDEGVKRLSGIIIRQESMGEAIATLLPLLLYMLAKTRRLIYLAAVLLFTGGVFMAATRSSIVLFVFFFIIYMLQQRQFFKLPQWFFLSFIGILVSILIISFFPTVLDQVIYRFATFSETYSKTGKLTAAINREGLWDIVFRIVIPNLSLMGNGMVSIIGTRTMHFHNLYLTVLHQMGIIGFITFFGFISMLMGKLFRSLRIAVIGNDRLLAYSALISLLILMVDSAKFEFNRSGSYQQFVWVLFAIYYLVGENIREKRKRSQNTASALS